MPIRTLLIWAVVALVALILFAVLGQGSLRGASELSYSDLLGKITANQIQSVETQGETVLVKTKDNPNVPQTVYVPTGMMPDVVHRLEAANVQVTTDRPRTGPSIGDILLGILPMLILIGAWFVFMRQMQAGGRGAMGFGRGQGRVLTEAKGEGAF